MSKAAKSALGAALVIVFPIVADVCGLELPKWLRFGILHVFFVWIVVLLLAITVSHLQEWGLAKRYSARASTVLVIFIGAIIGAVIAPIVWNSIRPDDIDIAQTIASHDVPIVGADSDAAKPDANKQATDPSDLEFYFHPVLIGGGHSNIQYSGATMTNRSPRKMHLELWAHIYYWKDSGEPASLGFQPEWNPQGLKQNTGQTSIDFEAFETKKGALILFLDKPEQYGVRQWNINRFKNVLIHAFDSVTGKHIAFNASPGYPDGKKPWPLPTPAGLLALNFPKAATSQNLPPLDSLDLLARTEFFGYHNDGSLSFSAVLTNRSSDRMKLQINLLNRKSVDDKEWRTFRGVLVPSGDKKKDHLDYYALDFGPGDVADCSLVFANTGFTNKIGEGLEESPSVSLLEIFDEVSRKKVWCAIEPGYPPGTDMRWAAIQTSPAIPKSDSDNTQKDESNDSK